MKYYLIAGEASGDLHGANLIHALKKKNSNAHFRCWGGNLMQAAGAELIRHYKNLAFMGFWEVIRHLPLILGNLRFCKQDLLDYQADVLILIDYPGFNLRVASFAKRHGIKVFYYISPQVWAWKSSRVHHIKKSVDQMLVIFPFEKDFYERYAMKVHFVGHPLLDALAQKKRPLREDFLKKYALDHRPIIALLPGSRRQEIREILPIMWSMHSRFPSYQFVVAIAPSQEKSYYKNLIGENFAYVENATYALLHLSQAALVTSGTATLETALLDVPQVVCYKASWLSYEIGRRLARHVHFISLVNLIMKKEVVKELIQKDFNAENLRKELIAILDPHRRERILLIYNQLSKKLGEAGASERCAQKIMKFLH
ncbi:lipid-A-disaccharide synthase [Bacteroidetes bacterium endosymbiont of Geopemphigus sp.]|uniref:lipid-A-disaccharide synthase n=1 Tax=Bacteroidetes bacterium endosymbiont of Geopemphigus sp. TaxID=2047937 RepID=UPI000CD0832A|nr:lipid-A-disaccharide synthase [Bacteroidetes bacterium endosymbiont of Geopemphigus sp.]